MRRNLLAFAIGALIALVAVLVTRDGEAEPVTTPAPAASHSPSARHVAPRTSRTRAAKRRARRFAAGSGGPVRASQPAESEAQAPTRAPADTTATEPEPTDNGAGTETTPPADSAQTTPTIPSPDVPDASVGASGGE